MAGNSNSGRRPKPAPLKLIEGRGNGRDSGGRKVPTPPMFTRIPPEKPDHLTPYASEIWDRIVQDLPKLGLLKEVDGPSLEMLCETYSRWRVAVEMRMAAQKQAPGTKGLIAKNSQGFVIAPWVNAETQASKEFRAWCAEYGLTPAAEMKLAMPTGDDEGDMNPFAGPQGKAE